MSCFVHASMMVPSSNFRQPAVITSDKDSAATTGILQERVFWKTSRTLDRTCVGHDANQLGKLRVRIIELLSVFFTLLFPSSHAKTPATAQNLRLCQWSIPSGESRGVQKTRDPKLVRVAFHAHRSVMMQNFWLKGSGDVRSVWVGEMLRYDGCLVQSIY